MVFPVLGHYLQTVAVPKHGDALKAPLSSYLACASCIALCREGKTDGGGAAALTDATSKHAEQKDTAYPGRRTRAKDHWRHHFGDQLARDGIVIDCFAGERGNRHFKQCAQEIHNVGQKSFGFEATALKRTLVNFAASWADQTWRDTLRAPTVRSEELESVSGTRDCFLSTSMVTSGLLVKQNDIVLFDGIPYEVRGCASVTGALAAVARELSFVCQVTQTASKWRRSSTNSALVWISEHSVRYAVAWYTEGDAFVILPL